MHLQSPLALLLRSPHATLRPTAARLPQPNAFHRLSRAGRYPGRGTRDRPPRTGRPAGRRHRREGESRRRPPAVEPEVLHDGQGHRGGCRVPRLCGALGLRARLPGVQGVVDAAHTPDGRSGQHLPTRRLDVPRHRRAPFPRGVPPQGTLRRHHHAPQRPQLRRGAPGPGPAAPVPLRPAEGYSGVRLLTPSRHRSDPGSERMGREANDEVLRGPEPA